MAHVFMHDAEMVRAHVAKYDVKKLDGRTLEILRETIDRDVNSFLPCVAEYEKHAPDVAVEAKRELASVARLRKTLEVN